MKINKSRNKQKKTRQLCLSILFMFMLCAMISVTPVTAATVDCDQILSTMKDLRLSTDQLEVEQGEIYQFEVLPTEFGWSFGWRISQVNFSDPDICVVHQTLPIGTKVKVAGTDQEFEISAQDQIANANSDDIDQQNNQRLKIYIEAKKTGNVKFKVLLANPSWEAGCTHGHACNLSFICDIAAVPQGTKAARLNVASNLFSDVQLSNPSLTLPSGQPDLNPDLVLPPVNDDNTSKPAKPGSQPDQQPDDSEQSDDPEQPDQQPDDPEQPDEPSQPNIPSVPSQPDNQPGATDPTPEPPTNPINPGDGTEDKGPLKQVDQSNWQLDTIRMEYNGQLQFPRLLNVQDEVQVVYPEGNINSGSYTNQKISFVVPEGYEPIPDMVISYTIEPLTPSLRHEFDPVTGEITATLENVIDADVQKIERLVNGAENDSFNPLDAEIGHYVTQTVLTIDPAKRQNYILDTDGLLSTKSTHDVKESTPWYFVAMEDSIEENGQIAVTLVLRNPKIDAFGTTNMTMLSFNLEYDESQLTYDRHESGYWDCMDSGGLIGDDNRIIGAYWGSTGPLPTNDTKICTIYFNVNEGVDLKDAVISTVNWQITSSSTSSSVLPFDYHTGPTSVVVNPTSPESNQEILVDTNPVDSTVYKYDNKLTNADGTPNNAEIAKKEQALQDLQNQIDVKFPDAAAVEPTSEVAPADTTTTPVDTAQTVQETSPAAPAPEMNTQSAPTDVSNEIVSIDNNLAEANPTVSTSEVENTSEPSSESSSSSTSESVEPTSEPTPESTPSADNSAEQFAA